MESFFRDIAIDGCSIQISTKNQVLDVVDSDFSAINNCISYWEDRNLYFLGGVDPTIGKRRAKDEDILQKNYVYIDIDVRKDKPDITDEGIKQYASEIKDLMAAKGIKWRYIVFTGNGIHIYIFGKEPHVIKDKAHWKMGLIEQVSKMEQVLNLKGLDRSCINPARLARLPGSFNCKNEKKLVEVLFFNDVWSDTLAKLEGIGKNKHEAMLEEQRKFTLAFTSENGEATPFGAIQELPIAEVVSVATGWEHERGHFNEPGSTKQKACFVPEGMNFLVHGNTDHIPPDATGFSPFTFVKSYFKYDNNQTFKWFKNRYPFIAKASEEEFHKTKEETGPVKQVDGNIDSAFDELAKAEFEMLAMGGFWDEYKFLIRGAITRISAYSNIGKSQVAYYFTHKLLEQGYSGCLFSTEVVRSIVLANLLRIPTGFKFWDIIEKRVSLPDSLRNDYRNLSIFDVNHTHNKLGEMEKLMKNKKETGLDFVVIDYVQGVTPKYPSADEYGRMTHYALEVQRIAQELNIAIIDLSQISNSGAKDDAGASSGFIPSKGSGHLVSSADIGVLLSRNKIDPTDNTMKFDIRKHKYLPTKELTLECNFQTGIFDILNLDM